MNRTKNGEDSQSGGVRPLAIAGAEVRGLNDLPPGGSGYRASSSEEETASSSRRACDG